MNGFSHIGGVVRRQLTEIPFDFIEFVFQHGFHKRRFAGKESVQRFLAHPQLGGKIVHADASETVNEKLTASHADHMADDRASGRRL
jgi:hypothetical protein